MNSLDSFSRNADANAASAIKSVNDLRDQANRALRDFAANTDRHSSSAGASVAQMASHITNSIGSLDGLHVKMQIDANGDVQINDMGLTHAQIASFHGVANGGIFQAGQKVFADGGMLPSAATIQPATGSRGLIQWAEPETHGEAFIPLAPTKRARSLDIWERTGKLLGAFADGGILTSFHDNASGPVDRGIAEIVKDAINTVSHLASTTMKQVQGAAAALASSVAGDTPIGYGGGANTIGLIEALANTLGVAGLSVTSTYRPNAGYHGVNEAVDFSDGSGWGPGSETPGELAFNRAWAAKYGSSLAELIHAGAGSVNIKDGKIVDGWGFYGAQTMMEHFNHVHVAISPSSLARAGAHPHAFATGGMPEIGRPYWTGENGPELQMALGPTRVFSHESSKAMARTGPLIHNDEMHIHNDVDLDLLLQKAAFLERTGHFG